MLKVTTPDLKVKSATPGQCFKKISSLNRQKADLGTHAELDQKLWSYT